MSAEVLRRAADRLDALADAATPGPWVVGAHDFAVLANDGAGPWVVERVPLGHEQSRANLTLIATLASPPVAKALPAWLRATLCSFHCDDNGRRTPYCSACSDSTYDHECPPAEPCTHSKDFRSALAVARAILGEVPA